ncbi:CGNR zinc finger domain-containing protein [Actinomadura sp. BRA 177]|uniref:CGNR zinc finger domain-containing protein n=1 Tax=Actinomadura sp. BRA 177 TaxID=2745202 RepID=UPI00159583E8|nr:CGNR zinc finger domain-containing protein [Actinomadura sp. BRA 177]NVI92516.1 CGNR zinc finger domain-containing protein [Actinomadura sp. BRA 177]
MRIPIGDYAAGAELANALVSTSPTVRGAEALADVDALAELLAGHWTPEEADIFPVQLLRREVRGIVETENAEQAAAGAAVLLRRAGQAPVLRRDASGQWQWFVPTDPDASLADELAAVIAVAISGVVRALGHERFRECAAPGCRGVFIDASRAGRRRYCMPERCGNRLNVANHRARRREAVR